MLGVTLIPRSICCDDRFSTHLINLLNTNQYISLLESSGSLLSSLVYPPLLPPLFCVMYMSPSIIIVGDVGQLQWSAHSHRQSRACCLTGQSSVLSPLFRRFPIYIFACTAVYSGQLDPVNQGALLNPRMTNKSSVERRGVENLV